MVVVNNLHLSTCMWTEVRGVQEMWYGHGITNVLITRQFICQLI